YNYLDKKLGQGNYVVALSADHGFPEIPEQTLKRGKPAKRLSEKEIETVLDSVSQLSDKPLGLSTREMQSRIKSYLLRQPFIADVYSSYQLQDQSTNHDKYLELYRKSYRPDRVPRLPFFSLRSFQSSIAKVGLMVRLKPNTMIDLDTDIHGSPYDYDRYVPLIFLGNGVGHGWSAKKVNTIDIAPSLARLAHITPTTRTDGIPLF